MKTKTLHGRDSKVAKMIIHLTKCPDFDDVYMEFEEAREKKELSNSTKPKTPEKDQGEDKRLHKAAPPEREDSKAKAVAAGNSPAQPPKKD